MRPPPSVHSPSRRAELAFAGVANAATGFNGTYTAVQKTFMIDPQTGAQVAQPDQVSTWIVFSACSLPGCTAHIVSNSVNALDMVFDGKQWNRLAIPPQTGNCGGATVPARGAVQVLRPRADGSLSGALTSTVDCGGAPVEPVPADHRHPVIAHGGSHGTTHCGTAARGWRR